MNWFNVLKNAGLAQSQRQGFRLDDKDEDYVLEDDDDCFKKLKAYVENAFNKLKPELELYFDTSDTRMYRIEAYKVKYPGELQRLIGPGLYSRYVTKDRKKFEVFNDLPDKDYCDLLDALKQMDFENYIHLDKPDYSAIMERRVFGNFDMVTSIKEYKDEDIVNYEVFEISMYDRDGNNIAGYFEGRKVKK